MTKYQRAYLESKINGIWYRLDYTGMSEEEKRDLVMKLRGMTSVIEALGYHVVADADGRRSIITDAAWQKMMRIGG